ncbi:MAG: zinc ribbon domain-containing protein [Chloroflexi bacterium]|nr:zinc ribbon domain-containing protein [Chloroflexota bacterium]
MEPTRIFHGNITPSGLADSLIAHFNRGNLVAQKVGSESQVVVQVATTQRPASGGQTALSITLQAVEDGVAVQLGHQAWLGVAASLGVTALSAIRNPFTLLGRLDDLAQDIENMQLSDEVWRVIETAAHAAGASHELSERLRRLVCEYCDTANPVGESSCIACGAPLGGVQPRTCRVCGFVLRRADVYCPNCNQPA